jgi:hypothetical protein
LRGHGPPWFVNHVQQFGFLYLRQVSQPQMPDQPGAAFLDGGPWCARSLGPGIVAPERPNLPRGRFRAGFAAGQVTCIRLPGSNNGVSLQIRGFEWTQTKPVGFDHLMLRSSGGSRCPGTKLLGRHSCQKHARGAIVIIDSAASIAITRASQVAGFARRPLPLWPTP